MHQLDIKVLNINDAWCNHEVCGCPNYVVLSRILLVPSHRSRYACYSQHSLLLHTQTVFFPHDEARSFTPIQWNVSDVSFYVLIQGGSNMTGTDLYGEECLLRRHSSPYCCWSLWWISADGTFSPTRNLITMRCSSLITLATPRQDWTGSNPSRREGGGCGFTLSRSHSCFAVRLVYIQISPGHIWTTLYLHFKWETIIQTILKANILLFSHGSSPLCFHLQICFLKIGHTQHVRQDKTGNVFRLMKPSSGHFENSK